MVDDQALRLERRGSVARIILARPATGNVIDLSMAEALNRAAQQCDLDEAVRCVVLASEGRLFCGGGDVKAFAAAGTEAAGLIKSVTANLHAGISRLMRMNKPLITVVQGPAGGAGMSLALLGDIVIAGESASFTSGYTALGLVPDGGLTWILPRLVGMRRAQELLLTNRRVDAREAAALGLVTRVVPDDQVQVEEEAFAVQLAASATAALGAVRNLLLQSMTTGLETQLELESRAISAFASSVQGAEGIAAFVEKRIAKFD